MVNTKKCSKCLIVKPLSEFRPHKAGRSPDGFHYLCKECHRAYENEYRRRPNVKKNIKILRQKRRKKDIIYRQKYRAKNRAKYLIDSCRDRCIKNGIEFNLDDYVNDIQKRMDNGICEITGSSFYLEPKKGTHPLVPSIDRIDPDKGYVYSNIRVVCWCVNAAMGNWGKEETYRIMKHWVNSRK